ncbi:glycosyltransferase family 4 protein [Ideonella sp. B7]|uniref:MraY family glycosyltransferase n=1 Tax=Ideonella benzenivorans TaxID=2831643 RepID=UPI001CED145F|nr:glycosyltransferase [Ideonella benzenivorans]MCA6216834.1 glycosyltransferase family 4 protein [Ideonella benzenivorans]
MIWILALSFAAAALASFAIVVSAGWHKRWSADADLSGPQKMHAKIVPRIGGLSIACGLLAGVLPLLRTETSVLQQALLLLLCALPAFGLGLVEDFTKAVSPRRRLFGAVVSGLLAIWLLNAVLVRTSMGFLDWAITAWFPLAVFLTVFYVAGLVNAVNLIDGLNGLASMSVALMLAALCYVALQVNDVLLASMALATLGATLGFFIWNYPQGLIFLGDGGAYLLGFLLAEFGLLLVARNPSVSPFAPLVLVAYPVFETVFTMYRRKVLQGRPVSQPDGVHLHTLIYRRQMRWAQRGRNTATQIHRNSMTSPYLWALNSLAVLPVALWWDHTTALVISLFAFFLVYLWLYWRIVRFQTPAWISPRKG